MHDISIKLGGTQDRMPMTPNEFNFFTMNHTTILEEVGKNKLMQVTLENNILDWILIKAKDKNSTRCTLVGKFNSHKNAGEHRETKLHVS